MIRMRTRAWVALSMASSMVACATIAGVDVTRPQEELPAAPDDSDERSGETEAGDAAAPVEPRLEDDATAGPLACSCDASAVCCVSTTGSSCIDRAPGACEQPGAVSLGCVRGDEDGRSCCWNADGGLHATTMGPGCAEGRTACLAAADCDGTGDTCVTRTCAGTSFGICVAPGAALPALPCPP